MFYPTLSYLESMLSLKVGGIIVAAFMAGAFLASPELRVYAANTVTSADVVNNTIQSVDIKDGEVKAADIGVDAVLAGEIAANAVGASEISGVSKLIFAECSISVSGPFEIHANGQEFNKGCNVKGAAAGDKVVATMNSVSGVGCFELIRANVVSGDDVSLTLKVDCDASAKLFGAKFSIIVYHIEPTRL